MIILCTWSTIVNVERSNEQLGLRWPQWGISFNTSFQAFLYPSSKTSKSHTSSITRYRFVKVNGILRCRIHMNCSLAISNSRKSTLDGMLLIKFHLTTLYDHSLDKGIPISKHVQHQLNMNYIEFEIHIRSECHSGQTYCLGQWFPAVSSEEFSIKKSL